MVETSNKMDPQFMQLVLSLQAAAMAQMGKVVSAMSGEIDRDLIMARHSIDLLGMIQNKTKGNLTEDEDKLLGHILYELRLNFVDETNKEAPAGDEAPEADSAPAGDAAPEADGDTEQKKD